MIARKQAEASHLIREKTCIRQLGAKATGVEWDMLGSFVGLVSLVKTPKSARGGEAEEVGISSDSKEFPSYE